jgi:hypothetical protein
VLLAALGNGSNGEGSRSRPYQAKESPAVAIYRLLQQSAFGPEEITCMVAAYEDCMRVLNLTDRSDPLTEIIAKKIIEIAQTGVRDAERIRQLVLRIRLFHRTNKQNSRGMASGTSLLAARLTLCNGYSRSASACCTAPVRARSS